MIRKFLFIFFLFTNYQAAFSQIDLNYYLPSEIEYNKSIPTPKALIGHEIGEWHLTHDKLLNFYKGIAEKSDRILIEQTGETYEGRPQLLLTISSKENLEKIEEIKARHQELADPSKSGKLNIADMPIVIWLGYSIHGNEPSGGNAGPLVAYHLAAAQGKEIDELLQNTIILLDPCYNPDGFNRFSTWVNMHKGKNLITDPNSREYNEVWPRGRTNHYWFDLNRDWLPVQHPESRARVRKFQEWKPNILTDHHEMGSNATFFFQPGVPQRTNPLTPQKNIDLTNKLGEYFALGMDEINSLYYSKEGFDDFYYGKGSTYPDVQGSIGILFEQASSRGHAQETINGILTFPFTIKNHFTASLATLKGGFELKDEFLNFQKSFYQDASSRANADPVKAYVFKAENDPARVYHFLDILKHHQIRVYELGKSVNNGGENFLPENSFIVPLDQPQYSLVKAIFKTQTTFKDSLFYDISTWTMPLAFNLDYSELETMTNGFLGNEIYTPEFPKGEIIGEKEGVAYIFRWDDYYAPRALYQLLKKGVKAKVSSKPFTQEIGNKKENFSYGTIVIPTGLPNNHVEKLDVLMREIADENGISIYVASSGYAISGIDLGSNSLKDVPKPKPLMVVGEGVSSYEAGEIWHLLDQRFDIPISMVEAEDIQKISLSEYNTLVMVNGNYNRLESEGRHKIKDWVKEGGVLILQKSAVNWGTQNDILSLEPKRKEKNENLNGRTYADYSNDSGAKVIGGAIFGANLDITHPIGYGYKDTFLPVFRNSGSMFHPHKKPYANPLVYTASPLLSGYISKANLESIGNTGAVMINNLGKGKVISMVDNANFRAFWFGTNKLFLNAMFFGSTIIHGTAR
ncbi:M14 family metallopeptidase [Flexithrix dorotheae]|uniref:M14 family metallopeptidase n=1 Tax=Flexithrix dorotheae TaxID=70993 RepID=UPI000377AFDB|nr:M14 family metallopeptidase [Flexithrix dorotheae]